MSEFDECPECGGGFDVALGWGRTNDDFPDEYEEMHRAHQKDHVGEPYAGWLFFHGVTMG